MTDRRSARLSPQSAVLTPALGLALRRDVNDAVLSHLTAALPHEGVGLLATEQAIDEGKTLRAVRFYPGTNIDASSTRFTMDPAEVLAALREIDENGWSLGAIVHSHPAGPASPSATDLHEARYPDALMVITSLVQHPVRLRAWRLSLDSGVMVASIEVPVWIEGEQACDR